MGALRPEVPDEGRNVVWIIHYKYEVNVSRLYEKCNDPYRVLELGPGEAALDYRSAQGVTEQEQTLLYTKGDPKGAVVRVVFHSIYSSE